MNITLFTTLLTAFATITGFITQGVKKILDEKNKVYSSNILACIVGCVVGCSGTSIYYVLCSIEFNIVNVICIFLMGVATAFGAMLGYDKIIQTITQWKTLKIK